MEKQKKRLSRKLILALLAITTPIIYASQSLGASSSLSDTTASWFNSTEWSPFIAFGGGSIYTSDVGADQTFKINNPVVDELYQYTPTSSAESRGLFDAFLGVEWNLSPRFALQTGLDYGKTGEFDVKGTFTQGADPHSTDTYGYTYKFDSNQLFAEGKLLFRMGRFRPYITAGLGGAVNEAEEYHATTPLFLTFTRNYDDHNTTAFAYNVGGGIDFDIDSHVRVGIGDRFTSFGKVILGDASIDGTSVPGTLSQNNFYSNEVFGQLTFIL
ncbi:MAG: porin family protein [Legionellales bacterium]|nr:porin family protein [Legionellales bacterium]